MYIEPDEHLEVVDRIRSVTLHELELLGQEIAWVKDHPEHIDGARRALAALVGVALPDTAVGTTSRLDRHNGEAPPS